MMTDLDDVDASVPLKIEIIRVRIDDVIIGRPPWASSIVGKRDACDQETVKRLAESISAIGLKTPITVRLEKRQISPDGTYIVTDHYLVAGAHRLEAARSLGWTEIDAFVLVGDEIDARLWQIAENLHRKELNEFDRSALISDWVELVRQRNGQVVQKPTGGRPRGGVAAAARELPVPGKTAEARRKTIERSLKIDKISPEAKEAAQAVGLQDNRSALLAIAAEPTKECQLNKVKEIASRKRVRRAHVSRKRARRDQGRATAAVPVTASISDPGERAPTSPAPFDATPEDFKTLRTKLRDLGLEAPPHDLFTGSAPNARPSMYAVLRIPTSLPDHERNRVLKTLHLLRGYANTQLFFEVFPLWPE